MHPEVKAAMAKGKKGDTDAAGKRKKGTGVFDIAQYIEETSTSADVLRTLLKKAMSKSYFWTEVNSNPMMRSLHSSFANQAAVASYWDKLAEEKDAVVSTDTCNEKTVEIAFDQSCAYVDKFSRTKKATGEEKEVKAPGQAVVDKMQRKLLVAATLSLVVSHVNS